MRMDGPTSSVVRHVQVLNSTCLHVNGMESCKADNMVGSI